MPGRTALIVPFTSNERLLILAEPAVLSSTSVPISRRVNQMSVVKPLSWLVTQSMNALMSTFPEKVLTGPVFKLKLKKRHWPLAPVSLW